jgi:hypothetical protein
MDGEAIYLEKGGPVMKRLAYLLLACGIAASSVAMATVIHVPEEYPTIQAGIDAANEGDTVLVNDGTYYENIAFRGENIYLTSVSGPEATVIDGSDVGSVFRLTTNEDKTTVIDGFTITHGRNNLGGGFYIYGAHPKIINNIISDNYAYEYGGGIHVEYGGITVRYNVFYRNRCPSNLGGPAIHVISSDVHIYKNLFTDQNGPADIFIRFGSKGSVINNTLSNSWHGISSHDYSPIFCQNNIVTEMSNVAYRAGDGGYLYCSYNCAWSNDVNYEECDPGEGALFANPLFVGGYPFDYHLQENSPCIDAGDPDSPFDPDGTRADMGAYYFHQTLPELTVTPDATVVERGGSLGYTVEVVNVTDEDKTFEYWSDLYLWTGDPYGKNPVFGPRKVMVKAGRTRSGHLDHTVPGNAPLETFTLCGRIGTHPGGVWSEDCFEFTVVEPTGSALVGADWEVIEHTF